MESNIIVQSSHMNRSAVNKPSKKIQNTKSKEKTSNPRQVHRIRKQTTTSYADNEDGRDNDVILRMVLPGYNWFEEQVKNNIYTSDGEKRIISSGVSTNPKLKIPEQAIIHTEPLLIETAEKITKQKSLLTKRVINNTLMLLPNNSLPLKKRKIKVEIEEVETELKEALVVQSQENKKMCNPPVQKVTPILNNSNSIPDTNSSEAQKEITVQQMHHPSAFKNDHLQKKYSNILNGYNSYVSRQNNYAPRNSFDSCLHYPPLVRKNTEYTIPDIRARYQAPCHFGSNYCYQCNMYRYQTSHLSQIPNQDGLKSNPLFQPNRTILPQKGYLPSNYYRSINSYDPLAIHEIRQTFPQTHLSPKAFENFSGYPPTPTMYHSEQMTTNNYNMTGAAYYPDDYWNKPMAQSYKPTKIDSMCTDYNNANLLDPLNVMPLMSNQRLQQLHKGYHHIG